MYTRVILTVALPCLSILLLHLICITCIKSAAVVNCQCYTNVASNMYNMHNYSDGELSVLQ